MRILFSGHHEPDSVSAQALATGVSPGCQCIPATGPPEHAFSS
ncbi:hypothetical protein GMO_20100 [Gluconobacter morbifer G707]|uniref:Uncharacterized protein n=1 Tax=Gluconobacter morbifer G707 TaxID=1088869 RepID=G6XKJ4_9PROT|nr:hypothetical protein GMO_20100 [Gluconobacter morbifer G707]